MHRLGWKLTQITRLHYAFRASQVAEAWEVKNNSLKQHKTTPIYIRLNKNVAISNIKGKLNADQDTEWNITIISFIHLQSHIYMNRVMELSMKILHIKNGRHLNKTASRKNSGKDYFQQWQSQTVATERQSADNIITDNMHHYPYGQIIFLYVKNAKFWLKWP